MGAELLRRQSFLRAAGGTSTTHDENVWEALCPELFALIVKAVQRNAGRDASEARRVVALAGVCRRWRQLIQQSYSSPLAEIGLLQFPFALRQPGPCNRPVQCLLKRKGGTFVLFQQNVGGDGGAAMEKLNFLMAARKEWRACSSCFIISANHKSFSKSGHAYMGKLQSDFWGAEFNLWEVTGTQNRSERLAIRITFSDYGLRQRAMACEIFSTKRPTSRQLHILPPSSAPSPSSPSVRHSSALVLPYSAPSLFSCFASSPYPRPAKPKPAPFTFLRSYSSLRRANERKAAQLARSASTRHSRELGLTPCSQNSIIMQSKAPHWDEQSQCWSLDFRGRALLPSQYSFQLVQPCDIDAAPDIGNGQGPHRATANDQNSLSAAEGNQIIFLQFGKVGKGLYTMDFCHPLSAFQAFSICLSGFASKVGVDP